MEIPNQIVEEPMHRLYWTSVKTMLECPQRYLWSKGHPDHDLGAGPGKPKPLPPEEERNSEHNLLMGSVLSKVVEYVYNHELWKDPQTLLANAERIAKEEFLDLESKHYCIWSYMTREDALNVCLEGARNFIRIMKDNRLLGPWSQSEFRMTPTLNNHVSVCGIADLIFRDKNGDIHILDGKNAQTPGKYEDPDQLRWYALAFKLQYGVTPKRLAFFYFRYPSTKPPKDYDPDAWKGMHEVSITEQDLDRLAQTAVEVSKNIHFGKFQANPQPKHCGGCPYENVCEARVSQRARNAAKRGVVKKAKIPDPTAGVQGFGSLKL